MVDLLIRHLVRLGGGAVIAAITLIFLFLVWVVLPIFAPASVERLAGMQLRDAKPVALSLDDTLGMASLITRSGELVFLDLAGANGRPDEAGRHALTDERIAEARLLYPHRDTFALLTEQNRLYFHRILYEPSRIGFERAMASGHETLFDGKPLALDAYVDGEIATFDVFRDSERLLLALLNGTGATVLVEFPGANDFLPLESPRVHRLGQPAHRQIDTTDQVLEKPTSIVVGPGGRWLYHFSAGGGYRLTDIRRPDDPVANGTGRLVPEDAGLSARAMLVGRYSVLVADTRGTLTQWSLRRTGRVRALVPVRDFHFESPITRIVPEPRRKGFVALASDNSAHVAHTTSHRVLASFAFAPTPSPPLAAFSPGSDGLLLAGANRIETYAVHNNHPEISWSTLWREVWYEGYDEPTHKWQSSSADSDFEPKFSLAPLLFGTLKASFYAMLLAIPLAVMGALYTACFMNDALRRWVRPGVEMMAGLPTVVLGFLAGIWLAPLVENKLAAVLLAALALPLGVLACALAWALLPRRITVRCEGWLALLTVPVLALIGAAVFSYDAVFETVLFDGDTRSWLQNNLGLDYDQRNALVIGMAMGFAVMPIIFSMAEQAIRGVPAHLAQGSLALGATRWRTVGRIALPTAAPGIIAAILIGVGRALGETMIVLMASGNSPILDMNLFQGLRTLTANIAVELPEAQEGSTHYRILFLIALLLFAMTFVFNTVAELVRERLRVRYARL